MSKVRSHAARSSSRKLPAPPIPALLNRTVIVSVPVGEALLGRVVELLVPIDPEHAVVVDFDEREPVCAVGVEFDDRDVVSADEGNLAERLACRLVEHGC